MTRIVITSTGTLGDFAPFVALGRRLQARGHRVRMAVNPAMLPLAESAGLEAVPCGRLFGPAEARERAAVFDHWSRPSDEEIFNQWRDIELGQSYFDLAEACHGADLLIASTIQAAAPMVHEKSGIPWVSVSLLPMEFPHADGPDEPLTEQDTRLWGELVDYLNQTRTALGFPCLSYHDWISYQYSDSLVLLASSSHFSQPIPNHLPEARMTGFWFESHLGNWSPDDELLAFLDVVPKPLILTFSSLPVQDASRVLALHVEAAARLDRRLLVQRGWAHLDQQALANRATGERVFFVGPLPHAWLFQQVSAVIHHGGIGTTAQAMRCGRPMLVEPYGNDQFFNARRILALGVGAAMHPHKLTVTGLARVLEEKVLTADVRRRALELATGLQAEDGLTMACDLIEQQLGH